MKTNVLFSAKIPSRSKSRSNNARVKPAAQLTFTKDLPFRKKDASVHYTPEYSCFPQTIGELVGIMQFARNSRKRLKVVSQGYSGSGMTPIADVLVYLQNLNRVFVDVDSHHGPVIVLESGATIKEVETLLASTRFVLPLNLTLGRTRFEHQAASSIYEWIRMSSKGMDLIAWVEKIDVNGKLHRFETGEGSYEVRNEVRQLINNSGIIYRIGLKLKTR